MRIEDDIATRVVAAVADPAVRVQVAGRDVELLAPADDDPALAQAVSVAARVDGVRRVSSRSDTAITAAGGATGGATRPPDSAASASGTVAPPSSPPPRPTPSAPPSPSPSAGSSSERSADGFPTIRIVYSSGTYSLSRSGMAAVNRAATYLEAHPEASVVIKGYSDSLGSEAAKKRISLRRALVAQAYLVSRGIDRDRTSAVAFSDSRPVASNSTAAGRALNRRVTIDLEDAR